MVDLRVATVGEGVLEGMDERAGRAAELLRLLLLAVLAPVAALLVLGLGWAGAAAGTGAGSDQVGMTGHAVVAGALLLYLGLFVVRAVRSDGGERRAWVTGALVAPVAGVVVVSGEHGAGGWGAWGRPLVWLFVAAAVVMLPGVRRRADLALALVLDGWALAAGPFVLLLMVTDATGLLPRGPGVLGGEEPLMGLWVLLDLLLLALLVGLLRRAPAERRPTLRPFVVSLAAATTADTVTWRGGLGPQADLWSDAAWALAVVAAAAGAIGTAPVLASPSRPGVRAVRTRASDSASLFRPEDSSTWVPAVVAGVTVLLVASRYAGREAVAPETVIVVLSLVGVVVAQVVLLLRAQAQLARRLHDTSTRYRTIVEGSTDVVVVCDADGLARFVSPASRTVLGIEPRELEGRRLVELAHDADRTDLEAVLRRARQVVVPVVEVVDQVRIARAGGGWRHVEVRVQPHDTAAVPDGLTLVMRDVSERVRMQRELERRARLDALTGLPNRWWFGRALAERLDQRLPTSVVFIDLDEFKAVNDTEGHAVGDRLLVAAARRLRFAVGETDVVGRLSGDEFAVVVGDDDEGRVRAMAERVLEEVAAPYAVGTRRLRVAASIGLAVATPGVEADTVLRDADLAMYEAKRAGGRRVVTSHPDLLQSVVAATERDRRVRAAVADDDFELVYQPLVDLTDGRVLSAEALMRWPGSGLSPTEFVPRLERTGLIVQVGALMLGRAVAQAAQWWRQGRTTGVSVNLSPLQLSDPELVDRVRRALEETGLPPDRLTLEVTESILLRDLDAAVELLREVRGLGVRMALDDFGTGFSSLSYLHRLPIDVLKVDRSFVSAAAVSGRDLVMLRSIVLLGQELGLSVVAEGVQEVGQVEQLLSMGCSVAQGFLLAGPGRAEDVPDRVVVPARGAATVPAWAPGPGRDGDPWVAELVPHEVVLPVETEPGPA